MTPERFQQIEKLYHAARGKTPDERSALLAQTDPDLRREVECLLAQRTADEFLDRPAPEMLDDLTLTDLVRGTCLGPYRIESKLGEGGMGEVFRAVDTRLGRAVAIKTMREQFSSRFEREARAISALNHPNICTLHDVGPNYLVMELVEGESLAVLLKNGPLPVETVLLYASQITAALVEAHTKGIIHRDIKPGNIMVGKSGVKVLDFGLARSGQDETATASHMIVGTPAYMAPEQRVGKPADARTDIYAFGCVLYEMLTGARVGTQEKRIRSRKLERVVTRCLEVEPGRRWQSAAELVLELGKLTAGTSPWKAASAVAAVIAVLAAAYAYLNRAPKLTDHDTVVVADFENKTGDPVFDDTLRQGLSVELQQSPFLSLLSDQQIQRTLALMGQPKDARLTPEGAQQVCERTGSTAVLQGSIASLGSQYVLGLRAKNCNTGKILDEEQIQAAGREEVLNSLSQIARKLRTRLGESLVQVERHSTPLADATTSSLDALKIYSTGFRSLLLGGGCAVGVPFFRRATEMDPKFALAYAHLGLCYAGTGESVLATESAIRAWQLRDRVSERERYFIDFVYDRQVTGNLEKAYRTLESWHQTYPRGGDPSPLSLLGGISTHGTGRLERAIEVAQKEIAARPDLSFGYGGLAFSYFFMDRFSEAKSILQRASEHKAVNPNHLMLRYNIATIEGDKGEMDRVMALAKGKQGLEHRLVHTEALALARAGGLQAAERLSSRAVDLAVQEGQREEAAIYLAARAVWKALDGNAAEGRKSAIAALEFSKGRDVQYAAGLALAFSGDTSRSEALAGDLEKRFPEDTFVKFTYAPVLRALAARARDKPAESLERLQVALPYELAANGLNQNPFYLGGLHSAYVRGEALIALRRYAEAVAEFQKILDHRGIVGVDPIGVLAHLQLGKAHTLSGDKAKAKSEYEAFLTLWKHADLDIPILKHAKGEYATLQ